jgi:hypothetical protein
MHKNFSALLFVAIIVWWSAFSKAESDVPVSEIYEWLLATDVGLEYASLVLEAWENKCEQLDEGARREAATAEQRVASLRARIATQTARYHDQLLVEHDRDTALKFIERTLQRRDKAREQMLESITKDSLRPDRCSVDLDTIRRMPPTEVEQTVDRYAERALESSG